MEHLCCSLVAIKAIHCYCTVNLPHTLGLVGSNWAVVLILFVLISIVLSFCRMLDIV